MLLYQRLTEKYGQKALRWDWTCCTEKQEPVFRSLLDRLHPQSVLDIGTHQGISALLLAEYAKAVVTIDIIPDPCREKLWGDMGASGKIFGHVYKSQAARDECIQDIVATGIDLVFIDGGHLMHDVEYDFNLCIPCRTVILHDYWDGSDWPDVKEFVDNLDREKYFVEIHKPFVLVREKLEVVGDGGDSE